MPEMSIWDRVTRENDGTKGKELQFFTVVRRSEEERSQQAFPPLSDKLKSVSGW